MDRISIPQRLLIAIFDTDLIMSRRITGHRIILYGICHIDLTRQATRWSADSFESISRHFSPRDQLRVEIQENTSRDLCMRIQQYQLEKECTDNNKNLDKIVYDQHRVRGVGCAIHIFHTISLVYGLFAGPDNNTMCNFPTMQKHCIRTPFVFSSKAVSTLCSRLHRKYAHVKGRSMDGCLITTFSKILHIMLMYSDVYPDVHSDRQEQVNFVSHRLEWCHVPYDVASDKLFCGCNEPLPHYFFPEAPV